MSHTDTLPKIKGKYRENADIGKMCWFKTSGIVDILFIPKDIDDLRYFLSNRPNNLSIYVMGIGSNMLIRDGGVRGVMIRLGAGFNYINHKENIITAGCAVLDLNVANYAAKNSIAGLEFFAGIPGSIGGALAMNAGAYGNDTSSVLIEAKAINMFTSEIKTFLTSEIGYYYRGKKLSAEWLFFEAKFKGYFGDKNKIQKAIDNIQEARSSTQPIKSKTGGSTFKNPHNQKAWQLIDKCGLRGEKIGGAKFSELHCNFLINEGGAKSSDLEDLIILARQKVKEKFNINLEEEIKILGH
ncbi:UDP-N-acetylmuramate dehydrogenase [Rickettsiales endosymbiont of Trichoplax sp. H2]|uniref:UDP-N-acetylmuramate dehydrogenase n=1 Tax=Rickettsiales endosymbiont of Trichoplax sp. H2 TaxID=2021221 RepID=UPI0012B1DCE8|nr:UDP-N-acetylmuramate dehydrogenase [Rickettsiales endosymbiont of Trichoplax sp. H2]MSO13731.1 UDP-N-acetylenolpyruvoylglucosamine reductase [Rickettsiales endosymbiont of Trichoplax sp. H2]